MIKRTIQSLRFYLFALSLVVSVQPSLAQEASEPKTKAFIGVATSGEGAGLLGHVFLLFQDDKRPLFASDVYQYNISKRDGSSVNSSELAVNTGDLIFNLKKEKFYKTYGVYSLQQDRTVILYELKLSFSEVLSLREKLDDELAKNKQSFEYGFFNNCSTRVIDLLNEIVGLGDYRSIEYLGKQKVSYSWEEGAIRGFLDPVLNRVPFYFARTLENHAIVRNKKIYPRKTNRNAKFYAAILKNIDSMKNECNWHQVTADMAELLFVLYSKNPEKYPLDHMDTIVESCSAASRPYYNILLVLYQLIDWEKEEYRTKIYRKALHWRSQLR